MAATYTGVILDLLKPTKTWEDSVYKKPSNLVAEISDLYYQFLGTAYSSEIVVNGGSDFLSDLSFQLDTESFDITDYVNEILAGGSLVTTNKVTIVQNSADKRLRIQLKPGQSCLVDDLAQLKWKWNSTLGRYEDRGFYVVSADFSMRGVPQFVGEINNDQTGQPAVTHSVNSRCGQEASYPAANAIDGNTSTEWRHTTSPTNPHWIILDAGGLKRIGGVDIWYKALQNIDWSVNVYVSATLTFGSPIVSGFMVYASDGAGLRNIPFAIQDGMRYVKIEITPQTGQALYDFGEAWVECYQNVTSGDHLFMEFKLHCMQNLTSTGLEYIEFRNISYSRFKDSGTATGAVVTYMPTLDSYDSVIINALIPYYPSKSVDYPHGIDVGVQLAVSDDGSNWSGYFGPDGTANTYFKWEDRMVETLPAGDTGYYFKWKFFLWSDGRKTPVLYSFWVLVWLMNYMNELTVRAETYPGYGSASPVIPVPLSLKILEQDSKLINILSGVTLNPVDMLLVLTLAGVNIDLLSGWERWARYWLVVSSWLESVVGQVIHGYVRDQNENIILNAFKVIITSTYAYGLDSMGTVDPATGFYELFVKSTIYDDRWLIAHLNTGKTFDIAYRKYGIPVLIDGTVTVVSPQDLHFWKPMQICGKSVAYVGSLATY